MTHRQIPLRDRKGNIVAYSLVSDHDFDNVMTRKWNKRNVSNSKTGLCYALSNQNGNSIRMHQFILGSAPEGMVIDHINNNGLDNRRENLRFVTIAANVQNVAKRKTTTSSQYKGVSYNPRLKRWRMQYGRNDFYRYFSTELQAATEYDKYVFLKFGESAKTNGLLSFEEVKDLSFEEEFKKQDLSRSIPKGIAHRKSTDTYRVETQSDGVKFRSPYFKTLAEAIKSLEEYQRLVNSIKQEKLQKHFQRQIERTTDNIAVIYINGQNTVTNVLVDDECWHELTRYIWHIQNGYVYTTYKKKSVSMHSYIMKNFCRSTVNVGYVIDHINGIKHDNRKCNLRINSRTGNSHNKRKTEGCSSQYIGVHKTKSGWSATIGKEGTTYRLGTFRTEIEAAYAYNIKASELYGSFANLNLL